MGTRIEVWLLLAAVLTELSLGQYYRPPPQLNNYYQNDETDYLLRNQQYDSADNSIEKKFVNSGQYVLLVCDLPNNMPDGKVSFIKYDNEILGSGFSIREDNGDERFEIGQQYAWEWSLKINSINEDDAGIYFCKVGPTIIKQFEIVVRVPPRIHDDVSGLSTVDRKTISEGDAVEFSCFASGTPKPNITWYVYNHRDQAFELLNEQMGSYLKLANITRYSPRHYQCRASNNIPPSDRRNITFAVEFAPEIEIQAQYNKRRNEMVLNCTINANPLTNQRFWRKDGHFINEGIKNGIKNIRLSQFTLVSQLLIKNYNAFDQGLYECTGENDLRVSKIVYSLKEDQVSDESSISKLDSSLYMPMNKYNPENPVNMFAAEQLLFSTATTPPSGGASLNNIETSTQRQRGNRKQKNHGRHRLHHHNHHHHRKYANRHDGERYPAEDLSHIDSASVKKVRKYQRLNGHELLIDRIAGSYQAPATTPPQPSTSQYFHNSPYILLLNDENDNDADTAFSPSASSVHDTNNNNNNKKTGDDLLQQLLMNGARQPRAFSLAFTSLFTSLAVILLL